VLSVEAHTARLRRATLEGVLAARRARVELVSPPAPKDLTDSGRSGPVRVAPYRPRARVVPAPTSLAARERVLALTGMLAEHEPARTLRLEPGQAAAALLETLEAWGELP
jgi:electron transfer flavoprotein beta subunit